FSSIQGPFSPITLRAGDEKLAAVCTGTTVCLMETNKSCMSKFKIFICKRPSVDTGDSSTISLSREKGNISNLQEVLPKPLPVEGTPLVSYWNPIFSTTKKKETWNDDRHNVCKELDLHAANLLPSALSLLRWLGWLPEPYLAANADIKEHHGVDRA
uniref:Uncharacterized protein n=1 Tax=Catagonus wagneri TaxID=51154 RepID=A0A8C3WFP5_9CETA